MPLCFSLMSSENHPVDMYQWKKKRGIGWSCNCHQAKRTSQTFSHCIGYNCRRSIFKWLYSHLITINKDHLCATNIWFLILENLVECLQCCSNNFICLTDLHWIKICTDVDFICNFCFWNLLYNLLSWLLQGHCFNFCYRIENIPLFCLIFLWWVLIFLC